MSGWYVKAPERSVGEGSPELACIAEDFPAIYQVLQGRSKEHSAGEMYPQTLMFFLDAGKLKFCLSCKRSSDVAFGVVKDPAKILESTEAALRAGEYEWKTRRR